MAASRWTVLDCFRVLYVLKLEEDSSIISFGATNTSRYTLEDSGISSSPINADDGQATASARVLYVCVAFPLLSPTRSSCQECMVENRHL